MATVILEIRKKLVDFFIKKVQPLIRDEITLSHKGEEINPSVSSNPVPLKSYSNESSTEIVPYGVVSESPSGGRSRSPDRDGGTGGSGWSGSVVYRNFADSRRIIEVMAYDSENQSSSRVCSLERSDLLKNCSNVINLDTYIYQHLPPSFHNSIVGITYTQKANYGNQYYTLATTLWQLLENIDLVFVVDITSSLTLAQSSDSVEKRKGEYILKCLTQDNPSSLFLSLTREMANGGKPIESRNLAAAFMKQSLAQVWDRLDADVKSLIKESLVTTVISEAEGVGRMLADVICEIALIDFPQKLWLDLFDSLQLHMASQYIPCSLNQLTLEIIGNLFEKLTPQELGQSEVNILLTALLRGLTAARVSDKALIAGTISVGKALCFCRKNSEIAHIWEKIMNLVLGFPYTRSVEIGEAVFQCFVILSSMYYKELGSFVRQLYGAAIVALEDGQKPVVLQAIKLLSSLLQEELKELETLEARGQPRTTSYSDIISEVLPQLVQRLLGTLLQQEDNQDWRWRDDSHTVSMAGGTCLGLVAETVRDEVLLHVILFVDENKLKQEWRCLEAAAHAVGRMFYGPDVKTLLQYGPPVLEFLLNQLEHPNNHVRDTTSWALSCIFEKLHSPVEGFSVITDANIITVLERLSNRLQDVPIVVENVCKSLSYLAYGFSPVKHAKPTSFYTHIPDIISSLWNTAEETNDTKLRLAAYDAIIETLRCGECNQTMPFIEARLRGMHLSSTEEEKLSFICMVIEFTRKQDESNSLIVRYDDEIVCVIEKLFSSSPTIPQAEGMGAIGALAYHLRKDFVKHLSFCNKYLEIALHNLEEDKLCSITLGVIGDVCQAIGREILVMCELIMPSLFKHLSCGKASGSMKTALFSCLGKIALAIGPNFGMYLCDTIKVLHDQIGISDLDVMDLDGSGYQDKSEVYFGIIWGFVNAADLDSIAPHAEPFFRFLEIVFADKQRGLSVTNLAVSGLLKLVDSLDPNTTKQCLNGCPHWILFLLECTDSDDVRLKDMGEKALRLIGKINASSSWVKLRMLSES